MKIHLFGLPISAHRRLKRESNGWERAVPEPHMFRATPISTNETAAFSESDIQELLKSVGEGFVHVIISPSRHWKVLKARLEFDCRVHVARLWHPARDIPWEQLRSHLHEAVSLDEKWLGKCCPTDLRHPLLLPPALFSTTNGTDRYWQKCDVYAENQLPKAAALLKQVEKVHRQRESNGSRSWIDSRKRRYRVAPSMHGLSPANRMGASSYRFCYEVPPGFHYDVADDGGRAFTVDIGGKSQKVLHCNVTPWGHVRPG